MKKLLLAVSVMALTFAGCTKNETVNEPIDAKGAIAFGPYSHLASRGTPINTNDDFSAEGSQFGVIAFFNRGDAKPYLGTGDGDAASNAAIPVRCDASKAWKYENVKYWPSAGLDFYAYSPYTDANATRTFSFAQDAVSVEYTVATDAANQQDFMVSGQWNKTKADVGADSKLSMPFRHALTQVVFKFANASSTIDIEVHGVKINNAKNAGTFTFDSNTGNDEYGAWTLKETVAAYEQTFAEALTVPAELPKTPVEMTGGVLMLMPQETTTAWDPEAVEAQTNPTSIEISCIIKDKDSGVVLWGDVTEPASPAAKNLRIGVDFGDWDMGKRVIYCVTFGTDGGTAGYDAETGEPVLLPILFTPSVVGWDDVSHNINM